MGYRPENEVEITKLITIVLEVKEEKKQVGDLSFIMCDLPCS